MLVGAAAFLGSEVVLSPVVSGCLPSCGGWGVVGVAASRTKTFRNQNHRFQSRFAYCKLFGVYAGVIKNKKTKKWENKFNTLSLVCWSCSDVPKFWLFLFSCIVVFCFSKGFLVQVFTSFA